MKLAEYEKLTDTDKAFLKLEGRCDGCGCQIANQVFIAHGEWCTKSPMAFAYNWDRAAWWEDCDKHITQTGQERVC